jgi:XTP/dITP diphosphohydrolase
VTPTTATDTLVVATGNRGKLEELRALLADLPWRVLGVSEVLAEPPLVVEDGETFADNALKKARAVARATMTLTLADDSGLEVDVLAGRPGVRSGRFAHDHATDAENNAALLAALDVIAHSAGVTAERRGSTEGFPARFRCVLALVDPSVRGDSASTVEGACEGLITRTPRGSGGFGYDPFFVVEGTGKTMAELSNAEKNRVSHRALAFASLRPALAAVLARRAAEVAAQVK